MKYRGFLTIIFATLTFAFANATVYLTKEGKVVASYEDDEVDAITFEDPTEYLIDNENVMLHLIYYGDSMSDRGYNFALLLADEDYDSAGQLSYAATSYMFRFNAPEPEDPSVPLLPEGTYKINGDASEPYSILPGEYSYVRQGLNPFYFTAATFNISYDDKAGKIFVKLTAEDAEGNHFKSSFSDGFIYLQDNSIKWYDEDVYINGGTLQATYLKFETGFDMNVNMNITIAEKGYDNSGWPVYPSNVITFVGNVPLDANGHFVSTTWNIMDGEVCEENSLLAGRVVNMLGAPFPVNTTLSHYYDSQNVHVALVKSGSATITETSPGIYSLTYDFTTQTGSKIQGKYEGEIKINGLPEPENFGLTQDYNLNLENAQGSFKEWSDGECEIDLHFFNQNYQYYNDRLSLRLNSKSKKLEPGVYKVINDGNCMGTITPGVCTKNFKTGSFFLKYSEDASQELNGAGIAGGQIEIIDNEDDTWTINIDLRDDTREAHKITGTWTGAVTIN